MKKTINIEGMACPHCEMSVKKALENLEGVETALVSHMDKKAEIEFSKPVDEQMLKAAVEGKGFRVISID